MGPAQLAGVMEIISRQAAESKGIAYDEEAAASARMMIEYQIGKESTALAMSGRVYDDGVIDPRDTRTVLGFCLSAVHSGPVSGATHYGVFRM
jgi:acetyl-CoA carboxylase carboxyltransferase component